MKQHIKKIIIIFSATIFIFQSCKNKTDKEPTDTTKLVLEDSISTEAKTKKPKFITNLLENLPTKNFPIIDSTNFDNFEKIGRIDNDVLKLLNLETKKEDSKNFRINYKIPFSENFTSIAFTYQSGDHELFTSIITVNNENKIIDMLEIAYDEIAESAFQKTSEIDKEKIIITEWNWMSGEPVTEIETYILQSNGKFKKVK